MRRVDVAALVENFFAVDHAVAIGVFQNQDAVTLRPFAIVFAVVNDFANPHAATMIDVNVCRTQ